MKSDLHIEGRNSTVEHTCLTSTRSQVRALHCPPVFQTYNLALQTRADGQYQFPVSVLLCLGPKGILHRVLVDTAALPKVLALSLRWRVANFYPRKANKRVRHYAYCRVPQPGTYHKTVYLHRVITDAPAGTEVDHRNHDGLDNRGENLLVCTHQKNMQNRIDRRVL